MKQSNNKQKSDKMISARDKTVALYLRISREDKNADESCSISSQRKLLTDAAKKRGFTNILIFIDDGITGTKRDRKEFTRMIEELKKGYIGAVMVKDLSRLARDNIFANMLVQEFFPEHDIKLIAIGDGPDYVDGDDVCVLFKNLVNEVYVSDISKKRRLSNQVKGQSGEPLSPPPYGYMKDAENPKRWAVDEEAAAVVRRIFQMTLEGHGTEQIAAALERDNILTPMNYWRSKGLPRGGKKNEERPNKWGHSTIVKILSLQEYCGDVINFKTYSKSYRLKKRIPNDPEDIAIFRDVHEPIIDRADWEKIQQQRGSAKKRRKRDGPKPIFSGFVVCADCGHNLWFNFNQQNPDITFFMCSNYKGDRGLCPTTHYIRNDFLEQVVLGEIRRLVKYAKRHGDEFMKAAIGLSQQMAEQERQNLQRELKALIARDRELDLVFNRMYEDNIAGRVDDERFGRMSRQYTEEQKTLTERIKNLRMDLESRDFQAITAESFLSALKKYSYIKKLTQYTLSELIERIEVFQAEKIDGVWQQKLRIVYHGIGSIEIPDNLDIPEFTVQMQTRKGVTVAYSPLQTVAV